MLVAGWLLVAARMLLDGNYLLLDCWCLEATCCWTAAVWRLLVGMQLYESYLLLDCCCMKTSCGWAAAVWILVVAGWLLVATGIRYAGWLLVEAGTLLVVAGVLIEGWILAAAWLLVVEFWLSSSEIRWLRIGHVTMQAWCTSEFEYWANRVEPRCNTLDFLLFLPLCNSNPFSFLFYCVLLSLQQLPG